MKQKITYKLMNMVTVPLKQMGHYFRHSKEEIAEMNISLMKSISVLGFIGVAILIMITPMIIPGWNITVGHLLLFPVFVFNFLISLIIEKKNIVKYGIVHFFVVIFLDALMGIIIYINTIPYPDSTGGLMTASLIIIPVLFILPFHETVIIQVITFIIYIILINKYTNPELVGNNTFNAITGLIFGVIVAWITINLRAVDNKSKRYYVKLSNYDKLTTILNKSAAEREFIQYIEDGVYKEFTLMILDMDDFKEINDSKGHYVGDQVLIGMGQGIKATFGEANIEGRFGGDEFVVLLKNDTDIKYIEMRVDSLRKTLCMEMKQKYNVQCTFSAGGVIVRSDCAKYIDLFNKADRALYKAKQQGKGRSIIV